MAYDKKLLSAARRAEARRRREEAIARGEYQD